ncbi:MAG: helix-turn-helix domain-containing protein [Verrucomicrobia bacterium]|nr:helix-turn-helix domain-containing protein [Verrucomicrobiota bacterium]
MHSATQSLLTKPEAARQLRVCVRTLENLMRERRLSYIKIGRARRFEPSEIQRFKRSFTVEAVS